MKKPAPALYFTLNETTKRLSYQRQALDLFDSMTGGTAAELSRSAGTKSFAKMFVEAVITSHAPIPMREELQEFYDNTDADKVRGVVRDGVKRINRSDYPNDFFGALPRCVLMRTAHTA